MIRKVLSDIYLWEPSLWSNFSLTVDFEFFGGPRRFDNSFIMIVIILVLFLTCLGTSNTWELNPDTEFGLFDTWGLSREKRDGVMTIKDKFPMRATVACEDLHSTDEAPFTAIILYKTSGRLLCMGSIIDTRHVLSAKRCYEKSDYSDLKVLVGYQKAYWGEYAQVKKLKHILRHEFEIVMLRLEAPITFTEHVQSVRLPSSLTKKVDDFDKVFPPPYKIVGFMVDRFDIPGDYIDKEKLYVLKEDQLLEAGDCMGNYSKSHIDPTKLFCTFGNATFCWGGWGAPVVKWMHGSYFVQVGVVIGDSCTPNMTGPLLAARTDAYIDWIRGNSYHGHQPV